MIPAVAYGAKSTEDVHGSIETQLEDVRAMAEREGWAVVGEFTDEGFSAYHGNRGPGFDSAKKRAAAAAAERGACMLVAQHTDRFARGAGDKPGAADHLGELYFWARRQNIRLRSVQDDANLEDPLRAVLIGERNTEDSARKSQATQAGKRRRVERGESAGPLPFGYRLVDATDERGNVVKVGDRVVSRRVPHPEEAPAVVEAFQMLDRGHNSGEITRWLNAQGFRTKRGKPFSPARVRDLLRNPWYGGKMLAYDEVREGNHEGLLSWEEFERISAKSRRTDPVSRAKRQGGRPSTALLSGVAFCARCGDGMWHRKEYRQYICRHVRHADGECNAPPVDAERVERAITLHLDSVFVDFAAWLKDVTSQRAAQRDGLVRELAVLHDQRANLARDEELVQADYMRQLRAENDRAAELATGQLERISRERDELSAAVDALETRLSEWDEQPVADAMLDWWSEFSASVRGDVVNAESVRQANTSLRERFAGIYVDTAADGTVALDFFLKDTEGEVFTLYAGNTARKSVPPLKRLVAQTDQALAAELDASPWCSSSR